MTEIKWMSVEELKKDIDKNPQKYTPPFLEGINLYFDQFHEKHL